MSEIVIIVGTNRNDSVSSQIAAIYKKLLSDLGEDAAIIDLKKLPPDFISTALYEKAGKNPSFNPFRQKILEARKFVFIVPEYNGSFPGVLKAFIDGLQYPDSFQDKKCALVGLSSGIQGAGLALSHLTDILNYCGTHVLALKVKLAFIDKYFKDGQIDNEIYRDLLASQASGLIEF
jgi:NAD(P)H-dependent FMN reductase